MKSSDTDQAAGLMLAMGLLGVPLCIAFTIDTAHTVYTAGAVDTTVDLFYLYVLLWLLFCALTATAISAAMFRRKPWSRIMAILWAAGLLVSIPATSVVRGYIDEPKPIPAHELPAEMDEPVASRSRATFGERFDTVCFVGMLIAQLICIAWIPVIVLRALLGKTGERTRLPKQIQRPCV